MQTQIWAAEALCDVSHRKSCGSDGADHVASPGGAIRHAHVRILHVGLAGSHLASGWVIAAIARLREGARACANEHRCKEQLIEGRPKALV